MYIKRARCSHYQILFLQYWDAPISYALFPVRFALVIFSLLQYNTLANIDKMQTIIFENISGAKGCAFTIVYCIN